MKIKYLFFNILIIIVIDLVFANIFWKKLATNPKYYALAFRCKDGYFHHSLRKNVSTYVTQNGAYHHVATNSLGMKDYANRKVDLNAECQRFVLIGDSFAEGIGLPYEKTFAGIFAERLKKEHVELLNAGVISYSPKLYYLKIKYLIENERLKFNKLFVFIDMSDIHDETRYYNYTPKVINENKVLHYLKLYAIRYSVILNVSDRIIERMWPTKTDFAEQASQAFLRSSGGWDNYYYNLSGWYADDNYELYGKEGFSLAAHNMSALISLCNRNGIEVIIAVYPWPRQVDEGVSENRHVMLWKKFAESKNIKFINFYPFFMSSNADEVISRYYVDHDFHFNEAGNMQIANELIKWYMNNR